MNGRMIDILIKNDNFSKEINTYNKIDELLEKDEVVYDGRVISLYEIDKILREKINYLKELTDVNNYVIDEVCLQKTCYYSKVDKMLFKVNVYSNSYKQVNLEFRIDLPSDVSSLTFRYSTNYDESRNRLKIIYRYYGMIISYSIKKCEDFYNKFILDNKDIIDELLFNCEEFYNVFNRDIEIGKELVQLINRYCLDFRFCFDLSKQTYNLEISFLDSNNNTYNLSEFDYFSSKKNETLKRISVNIDDLNPFFKNEIDKYYNSINYIDYKSYRRKK